MSRLRDRWRSRSFWIRRVVEGEVDSWGRRWCLSLWGWSKEPLDGWSFERYEVVVIFYGDGEGRCVPGMFGTRVGWAAASFWIIGRTQYLGGDRGGTPRSAGFPLVLGGSSSVPVQHLFLVRGHGSLQVVLLDEVLANHFEEAIRLLIKGSHPVVVGRELGMGRGGSKEEGRTMIVSRGGVVDVEVVG